jgi:HAE1 family hydrophobic/amphiphilic exporter-1
MISFSVRRPVAVTMLCLGMVVLGLISAGRIPMQLMPAMERPEFRLTTDFKGAGPEEVESQVTTPIERSIATVPGIESSESVTTLERSEIRITLKPGIDLLETLSTLRDRVDAAGLPEGTGKTRIERGGSNQEPLMRVAFPLKFGEDASTLKQAETLKETVIRDIERLEGVAMASFAAIPRQIVELRIHPAKLQAFGLSISGVAQQVTGKARTASAGEIREQGKRLSIKVGTQAGGTADLMATVLKREEERFVRLSDVAEMQVIEERPEVLTRLNGEPTLILEIRRESAANSVEVSQRIRRRLALEKGITILFDEGAQIEAAVENVQSSVKQGAILAAFCVYLLIQAIWPTFVVTVIIPLSILLTLIGMYFAGVSFNLMSLAGLALGVGMLVDSSMVVLESINAEALEVNDPREAALRGTRKVFGAVAGSNLATIAVFLPLAFIGGTLGQVFRDVALTVSFCLVSSLFVSISVVPMLCAIQRRGQESVRQTPIPPLPSRLYSEANPADLRTIVRRYASLLHWAAGAVAWVCTDWMLTTLLRHPSLDRGLAALNRAIDPLLTRITRSLMAVELTVRSQLPKLLREPRKPLVIVLIATVMGVAWLSRLGSELFPEDEAAGWLYRLEFPPGQVLEATEREVLRTEKRLLDSGRFTRVASVVGSPGAHVARMLLVPVEGREYEARVELETALAAVSEVFYTRMSTGLLAEGKPLRVEIFHDDLQILRELATVAERELKGVPGVTDIESDTRSSLNELEIRFQKPLIDHWELEASQFVSALRSELQGESAGMIFIEGRDASVRVKTSAQAQAGLAALKSFSIPNRDRRAYLSDVAQIREVTSPALIRHIDRRRVVTLSSALDGTDIQTAGSNLISRLDRHWKKAPKGDALPESYRMGGQEEARKKSQQALLGAIGLSIFVIFLLLASQFESLVLPVVVLLTVPLCISGVGVALGLTSTPISAQVLVGFVILVGASVNTSIVLVDFANQMRTTGSDAITSIIEATVRRLRPIIVTTATNIIGLIPMVLATGEGAAMQRPLALTLVGGILSSTLLCLFIVPLAYSRWEARTR